MKLNGLKEELYFNEIAPVKTPKYALRLCFKAMKVLLGFDFLI